jgi:hypothetical protein
MLLFKAIYQIIYISSKNMINFKTLNELKFKYFIDEIIIM